MTLSTSATAQFPDLGQLKQITSSKKADEKANAKAGTPKAVEKNAPAPVAKEVNAPSKNIAEVKVAETASEISVQKKIPDAAISHTVEGLLSRYPGIRSVGVHVEQGVATLSGQVEDESVRDSVTDFARKVEGVRLVLNSMKTDAQVMTAGELTKKVLAQYRDIFSRNWILVLVAIGVLFASFGLARLFTRYSDTVLSPFLNNPLLRSVAGSILSGLIALGGVMLALSVLNLTQAVLSILGLAGVVGLALGFAFKDIAENFIASVLLGVRRPFHVGDYIKVANHAGVVLSLNTRATVLSTLEGNQVRIPNAIIFKEILVNNTASATNRGSFDVVIPYVSSTSAALTAMTDALKSQEGVLPDPPARALVEALEPNGVRIRTYYWMESKGVDGNKIHSDAKLKVKVALMELDITPTPLLASVSVTRPPLKERGPNANGRGGEERKALANLKRDSRAADAPKDIDSHLPIEHILKQQSSAVTDEGANLLQESEPAARA